jgi:hypothetical protein
MKGTECVLTACIVANFAIKLFFIKCLNSPK